MTSEAKRGDALQLIFSLFLGVLVVVVVGVGVWTFYPPPDSENSPKQQELNNLYQEQEKGNFKGSGSMTPSESAAFDKRQERINQLQDEINNIRRNWAVVTSIIVLSIATVLMAISLFLPEATKVFSNGILLGGLFTVLYGTGVSFTGGNSKARFFVVLVALILSLAIGYLRFVRGRQAGPVAVETGGEIVGGDLEARVSALESRFAALTSAFGGPRE